MPRHQIRNPSLLDPSRGSTASASPLASLSLSFTLSLFPSFFPALLDVSLVLAVYLSLSLSFSVSRERAHVKSLKGDEQTTRKPSGALSSRGSRPTANIFAASSLLPSVGHFSVAERGGGGECRHLKPLKISFPLFFLSRIGWGKGGRGCSYPRNVPISSRFAEDDSIFSIIAR